MRPTGPLLLITVLQGVSGGLVLSVAALWWLMPADRWLLPMGLWGAFVIASVGGVASLFHMHKPKAGRFILRRLKTSWLSREALTTGIYVPVLAILVIVPHLLLVAPFWYGIGSVIASGLALIAMYVTAMLYATIPAMRSWHTPLTVVSMMWVGLVAGTALTEARIAIAIGGHPGGPLHLALLGGTVILAGIKWLQYRYFSEARQAIHASTGTGMPGAPYRLIDSGTTKLPYRTQTQVWPSLELGRRAVLYMVMGLSLILVPFVLEVLPMGPRAIEWASAAGIMVCGAFIERWIFFADVTHSSKIWFGDELQRPSSVSSNRVSPDFARRLKQVGMHRHDGL